MKFTTTCIYLSMSHSTTTFGTPYASDICVAIFLSLPISAFSLANVTVCQLQLLRLFIDFFVVATYVI